VRVVFASFGDVMLKSYRKGVARLLSCIVFLMVLTAWMTINTNKIGDTAVKMIDASAAVDLRILGSTRINL